MIVYIVLSHEDYGEGMEVDSVYATRAAAEQRAEQIRTSGQLSPSQAMIHEAEVRR